MTVHEKRFLKHYFQVSENIASFYGSRKKRMCNVELLRGIMFKGVWTE